jgi:hypothetical protein
MMHQHVPILPEEVDVDGRVDPVRPGIEYRGKARRQPDGTWRCLAAVGYALCIVEVRLTFDTGCW